MVVLCETANWFKSDVEPVIVTVVVTGGGIVIDVPPLPPPPPQLSDAKELAISRTNPKTELRRRRGQEMHIPATTNEKANGAHIRRLRIPATVCAVVIVTVAVAVVDPAAAVTGLGDTEQDTPITLP